MAAPFSMPARRPGTPISPSTTRLGKATRRPRSPASERGLVMKFLRGLWQGWREFWALSWWGKGPMLATVALLLIIAIASAGGDSDAAQPGGKAGGEGA